MPVKGKVVVFDDGIKSEFPSGKLEMQVKVTASKGGKTGEDLFVVATTKCRCSFEVRSGKDTLVIK